VTFSQGNEPASEGERNAVILSLSSANGLPKPVHGRTIDIVVPATYPLSEAEWDQLEEAINKLDSNYGRNKEQVDECMDMDTPRAIGRIVVGE
jgi:hypothetical protein